MTGLKYVNNLSHFMVSEMFWNSCAIIFLYLYNVSL